MEDTGSVGNLVNYTLGYVVERFQCNKQKKMKNKPLIVASLSKFFKQSCRKSFCHRVLGKRATSVGQEDK